MKITVHWDRVIGLTIAILVVFIAIQSFRLIHQADHYDSQEIGQCDMIEAQKIIDNLVSGKGIDRKRKDCLVLCFSANCILSAK